jgi:arabinofuranosyltransferase
VPPTRSKGLLFALGVIVLAQLLIWDDVTDDAYISFRYVERWVEGLGLTFNPCERVEGFSNPLWVGLLAMLRWMVPTVEIADAARGLGLAAAVVSLLAMAAALRRSNPGREPVAVTYAAVILALTPGFHVYATAGLETPLLGVLVTLAVYYSLADTFASRCRAAACLALGAVCRPEAALYCLLWWLFTNGWRRLRTTPGREMAIMTTLSAPFVAYEAFRIAYFGELLPNTFLAKPPGIFGGVFGIGYLLQWAIALGAPLLVVVWRLRSAPLEPEARLFLTASAGPILAASIFVVYSSGDWMPFGRFLVPVAPLLAGCVATLLARWTAVTARERSIPPRAITRPVVAALVLSAFAAWSPELQTYIRNEGFTHIMRGSDQLAAGRWLAENVTRGSSVGTKRLGGISFAAPDLIFWDLLGLTDREQAHFINQGTMFGGGASPIERRLPDVMAVVDVPGSRNGYKSEPGTLKWLAENYVLVKTLPQGPAETFDIWVAKKRSASVLSRVR